MRENAVDYINYYIAKKPDDEFYIDLLTNYKGDLKDDFDSVEVQKSKMNYVF